MASAKLADITGNSAQVIGRYFSIVSMIPSMMLAVYTVVLVHSGAWSGHPNWSSAVDGLSKISLVGAAFLIMGGMAFGLLVHPLQFSIVQFFEGYWGASRIAKWAAGLRVKHHQQRWERLHRKHLEQDDLEAQRLLGSYPEWNYLMPTRLGNVIRRHEMRVGSQYGLEVLTILPHMALVAQPEDVRYLDDQRAQLDLAVRLSFTCLLACALSVVFLWRDGLWLFVAMIPYGLAYVAYRGAVVTAEEFGVAMKTLVDLNRFALYERLRLPAPDDVEEEVEVNGKLMTVLKRASSSEPIDYEHPPPPVVALDSLRGESASQSGSSSGS